MTSIFETRIDAGIKWLDEQRPDWRSRVDLDYLNMGDASDCILGQVFGHFWKAVSGAGTDVPPHSMTYEEAVNRGFTLDNRIESYQELTNAWRIKSLLEPSYRGRHRLN